MEPVDAIVVELIAKGVETYERNYERVIAVNGKLHKSVEKLQRLGAAPPPQYGGQFAQAAEKGAVAHEKAAERIKRSRKQQADTSVAQDEREVRSAKVSAKAKADAEITEAQRSARIRSAVEKGAASSRVLPGSGANLGRTVAREGDGGRASLNATGERLTQIRLINQLKTKEIAEDEIALKLEQQRAMVEKQRARDAARTRTGPGIGTTASRAVAGAVATVAAVAIAANVIESAVEYGRALAVLSDRLEVSTDNLQAYSKLATQAGVSQEQLTSALGQFANNLGRAKQGSKEQAQVFKALRVNVDEFTSTDDALLAVIDRISQIKDPTHRAAIEMRLFGEAGGRLDSLLSGGAGRVTDLAAAIQKTGEALSASEIQRLDETAQKLAQVRNELQTDFSRVVANNADAIVRFAQAFGQLAGSTLSAIQQLREFIAVKIVANNLGTESYVGRTRSDLLASSTGRKAFADQNREDQAALDVRKRGFTMRGGRDTRAPEIAAEQARIDANVRDVAMAQLQDQLRNPVPIPRIVRSEKPNMVAIRRLGASPGPKGPSAETLAKQADQRQRRYEEELARATEDLLRARRELATSADERYRLDQDSLKAEFEHRTKEIEREANEKQIDKAKVAELQAAEKVAYQENLAVLALQNRVRIDDDASAVRQGILDSEVEMLGLQEQLATTASERRDLAKKRLAAERAAETNSLSKVFFSEDRNVSKADRQAALARYQSQDARFALRAEQEGRANEGPLASYRRRLNRTPGETAEAVEGYVVDELDAVHDAITGAIQKAIGVKDPLLSGLLDLLIDQVIMKPLLAALDKAKGDGGGGPSGFIQGIASFFGGSSGARASGGNVVGGNSYLVGESGPEIVAFNTSGKVYPNGALPSIGAGGGGPTIIAPQHFDLTGVVMTEPLLRQMEQRNRQYANAVAAQAGKAAVAAAPGRMQKLSDLGS